MLPLIYLLWRHQWGTYIDSSDINLFSLEVTSPWSGDSFYPILIKLFVPRCLPRSLMEKLWMCGASEWSLTSSSAATRLFTMRTMQIYSLRFSKVGRQDSDFVILLFFHRRVRVRLALLGRYQRRGKRLHSLTHVCQRREQTYLPVSFLQFTFTFMSSWSLSLSILWLLPLYKSLKTFTFLPVSASVKLFTFIFWPPKSQ